MKGSGRNYENANFKIIFEQIITQEKPLLAYTTGFSIKEI